MKKVISTILGIMLVATLFSVISIVASADDGITVNVGATKYLGNSSGKPDYYNDWSVWTLSDETLAEIYTNEQYDNYITFLEPGRLVVTKKGLIDPVCGVTTKPI